MLLLRVMGNALRELDQHFGLFLDAVWTARVWSKLNATAVSSAVTVEQISGETNVAKKFGKVMKELGDSNPDTSLLWSLSNARNCLTHNIGRVMPRYAHSNGALAVKWLGLEARIEQDGQHVVIPGVVIDRLQAPDPSKDAQLVVVVVEHERRFAIGQRIELTAGDLHEVCFYYQHLAGLGIERFAADLAARGIGPAQTPPSSGDATKTA